MFQRFSLIVLSVLCFSASLVAAEEKSPAARLAASKAAWNKASAESKGNYEYGVRFTSAFGFGNETILVVKNHKIVERRYRAWSGRPVPVAPGEKPKEDETSWKETGDELGKHKEGAPLKTVDDLYDEALKVADRKIKDFEKLYIAFDAAGILQYCFVIDTRIADDTPRQGVTIDSLKFHKPAAP